MAASLSERVILIGRCVRDRLRHHSDAGVLLSMLADILSHGFGAIG
jgi:hypothetical protein